MFDDPTRGAFLVIRKGIILAGGSASGLVIRNVKAVEARSWTIIHVHEGGDPRCANAVVENNEIGPSGAGGGIAFACTNSVVRNNTITDVPGVEVGYETLISGDGPLQVGRGPVRTGVTAVLPLGRKR